MVFEDLIGPISARRHPLKLFFYGVVFAIISVVFSLWIFPEQASLVMVFLVVFMVMPLMYFTLRDEEEWDWRGYSEKRLFYEHSKAIRFLLFLFIGFVVGFSLFYLFLPDDTVRQLFSVQLDTISNINGSITGGTVELETLSIILSNNIRVLLFTLLFALFFGAGALFILAWNASVISAAVGTFFRNAIADSANLFGFSKAAVYFHFFSIGILRYLTHGIFEIAAYFFGALAGGILSMNIMRHGFGNRNFKKVLTDTVLLAFVALVLLLVGALIEVFITPLIF